jgi:hypothetical protein
MTEIGSTQFGSVRIEFAQRLGTSWQELADFLGVAPHERAQFPQGREPSAIWEWLALRGRLKELPDGLAGIGRADLAELIRASGAATSDQAVQGARGPTGPLPDRRLNLLRLRYLLPAAAAVFVIMVILVINLNTGSSRGVRGGSRATGGVDDPPVKRQVESRTLVPSSNVATNDRDKIDLDSGCPGWGGMSPKVGPSRCGALADLIVDDDGVHNSNGRPSIVVLPSGSSSGYAACARAFDQEPSPMVSQVELGQIETGLELCVLTDEQEVSRVQLVDVQRGLSGGLTSIKVTYIVWTP